MRAWQTGLSLYFIFCGSVAHAACNLPDDGSNLYLSFQEDACPRLDWSTTDAGTLTITDHGEALWVDASGVLHIARATADVPEPYRSMYVARRTQSGQVTFADAAPRFSRGADEVADDASPRATARLEQQQQWRDDMATWRMELYTSTRAFLEAVLNPAAVGLNPLAFAYAPGRVQLGEQQKNVIEQARSRVLHARHMLLEVLPRHAREDGVPPQWLQ